MRSNNTNVTQPLNRKSFLKIGIFPIIIFGAQKKWFLPWVLKICVFFAVGAFFHDRARFPRFLGFPGIPGSGVGIRAYIDHFLIPGLFLSPAGVWRVVFRKCPMPEIREHGLTRVFKITPLRKDTVKIVFFDMVRWRPFYSVLYHF